MVFNATKAEVFNRGVPPDSFLTEQVEWTRSAPDELFLPNTNFDIFNKVSDELGPFGSLLNRRAVICEVERVLAGFESSWDWKEGVDTSRLGDDSPENSEAGAWQVSYDARRLDASLRNLLVKHGIQDGVTFQQKIKFDHPFAMEFETTLLRIDVKNPQRLHNGPLYKGEERNIIRSSLREAKHSIYPWLSRDAVAEFETLLST